ARSPCRSTKRNIATPSLKRVTSRSCPRRWLRSGGGPTRILIWGRVPTGDRTAAAPTGVHGRIAGSRGVEKGLLLTHPPRRASSHPPTHRLRCNRFPVTRLTRLLSRVAQEL